MIRIPMLSEVEDVVRLTDMQLEQRTGCDQGTE